VPTTHHDRTYVYVQKKLDAPPAPAPAAATQAQTEAELVALAPIVQHEESNKTEVITPPSTK
jgi:hypothetical protein